MHSPRRCSHPSKNSTRPQPHHVTVAVAPLPFPPVPLVPSDQLRCQSRPFEIRLTGAPASRLSSTVESVTPIRPLPAGGALSFLGFVPLQGPFLRLESHRALSLSPRIDRRIRKICDVRALRSAPTRLAPREPHRLPPCGERPAGVTASACVRRRSPSPPGTRHRGDSEESLRPGSIDTAEAA
jgi:hypothetical protein